MNQSIEQEVIRKLDQISQDMSEMKTDISKIKTDIAVIKANQGNIKEQLSIQQNAINKIPDLAEKVGELKNWRRIALIIITGTASTAFGYFSKVVIDFEHNFEHILLLFSFALAFALATIKLTEFDWGNTPIVASNNELVD
ncbi:MAG: hypothetical protein AAF652_15315 [Cyanobacteria bacterium P01_C01_bin.72]